MSRPVAPFIDLRNREQILTEIGARLPGYYPSWRPQKGAASNTLLYIYAQYLEIFGRGLNGLPERHFLAYLDSLGISLLPAQGARAPLAFTLLPNSSSDTTLPRNSQIASSSQPTIAFSQQTSSGEMVEPVDVVFATEQTVTLTRSKLSTLYSIQPGSDLYAEHTASLIDGFTLFDRMKPIPHEIYLGHDELFKLAGDINIILHVDQHTPAQRDSNVAWEYLTDVGWLPLEKLPHEDTTNGFTQAHGQIVLRRTCGPDAKKETIHNHTSYWLRGYLTTPLPPQNMTNPPLFDTIRVTVQFHKDGLQPEAAFHDTWTLDTSKDFYPFGMRPTRFGTFYLASKEVFQRKRASVRLNFKLSRGGDTHDDEDNTFELMWEYFNGNNWARLNVNPEYLFTENEVVTFSCPSDWVETDVNGAENYWLRVRILWGNYGDPPQVIENPHYDADTYAGRQVPQFILGPDKTEPPVISELTLGYIYQTDIDDLDYCVTYNDFKYSDHSNDCRWKRRTFMPFQAVSDRQPTVHFGFDQRLPAGLLSMYAHVPYNEDNTFGDASPYIWEYRTETDWNELSVLDETSGFQRSGMIQFIGPRDAIAAEGLGGELYRIRARLKQGEQLNPASLEGVWLNAVWATHRQAFSRDVLGHSDGNPYQSFRFPPQHIPVLEQEIIEVLEWSGQGRGWEMLVRDIPENDLRYERSPASQEVRAVWVRWHERPHLFDAVPHDRVYVIERANGWLRFGDGQQGMIPPAGARIAATYNAGGGVSGNVPVNTVTELRTGVSGVISATNPVPAAGGADSESVVMVKKRGVQTIRHCGRAVAAEDFEWLAYEASPAVARARCLPLVGPDGKAQRGWVTLVIIPYSTASQPQPTAELLRRVREHLTRYGPATVGSQVRLVAPEYVPVSVRAEITPLVAGEAALIDERLRRRLADFLHPLTGGPNGEGWEFGQSLHLSQIASVIENTPGVDYAEQVLLLSDGEIFGETVPVDDNRLIATGSHELKLTLGGA